MNNNKNINEKQQQMRLRNTLRKMKDSLPDVLSYVRTHKRTPKAPRKIGQVDPTLIAFLPSPQGTTVTEKIYKLSDFKKWGREGGKKAQSGLTSEQRSEAARRAVQARWAAYRKAHPE